MSCLSVSVPVVPLAQALLMQALQAVMLEGRAGILRSARLPPRTVVEVAAMGKGLLHQVLAVVAAASARKAQMRPLQGLMAVVEAAAVALRLLVSVP